MQPTPVIYLIESEWGLDKKTPEIATITIPTEGPGKRSEFECLVNPETCPDYRARVLSELKRVARAQVHDDIGGEPRLVRLYRITQFDGSFEKGQPVSGAMAQLNLGLRLICEFDEQGNPQVGLREIALDQRCASPGKYRVVAFFGSILCQVGEEADTLEAARGLCKMVKGGRFIRIYDDQNQVYVFDDNPDHE